MDLSSPELSRTTPESLLGKVESITKFALKQHTDFDLLWHKPSYHNQYHIQAALGAVDAVFHHASTNSEQQDPFELRKSMNDWNAIKGHENVQIPDLETLHTAFTIAFACHDLGNISDDSLPTDDGGFNFATHVGGVYYRGRGSELRSEQIAQRLIEHTLRDDPNKELMLALVQSIIHDTIFVDIKENEKSPFWQVVQTIDQVGSAYFSELQNEDMVAGLIQEATIQDAVNPAERTLPKDLSIGAMIGFTNFHLQNAYSTDAIKTIRTIFENNPTKRTQHHFEFSPGLGNPADKISYSQHMQPLLDIARIKANQSSTYGRSGIL